jgi:UDPglucose--hexose-1-phosphate uridylyltransferase
MANEFRQDPLTGDWVLIAPKRGARPNSREKFPFPDHACPFDGLTSFVEVIPNKYPAVQPGQCGPIMEQGLFSVAAGVGTHELVITKDHNRHFANFTNEEMAEVISMYLDRYRNLAQDECNKYITIFHNHGMLAGASIYHNHSQILSTPILPPQIQKMLARPRVSQLLATEQSRIVCQNDAFVAFCPFASRSPYEINIFPKNSQSNFGDLSDVTGLASIMREIFVRLDSALEDPDYTYFIHTAPPHSGEESFDWHVEIMPRFSPTAGFEFGTGIFINTVDPDDAAQQLREVTL